MKSDDVIKYLLGGKSLFVNHRTKIGPDRKGKIRKYRILSNENYKEVQARLLKWLYQIPTTSIAHGSIPKCSAKTNADHHKDNAFFFKTDIEGAFPSTKVSMIKKALVPLITRRFPDCDNPIKLANFIATVTTDQGFLPQGPSCSPYIFNLTLTEMDYQFVRIANHYGLTVTRYLDDIVFSSPNRIPKEARNEIFSTIISFGYTPHRGKTYYQKRNTVVTGINVGEGKELSVKKIEEYRTFIHRAAYDNPETHLEKILGIIGWVKSVNDKIPPRLTKTLRNYLAALTEPKHKTSLSKACGF